MNTATTLPTASDDSLLKLNAALQRAIPVTRLVDYGVPLGDAIAIHARTGTDTPERWDEVCEAMASRHARLAAQAAASGANLTAAEAWAAAAALYQAAQLAFNDDTTRKRNLYEAGRQALLAHRAAGGQIEHLELPSAAGTLYGWSVPPASSNHAAAVLIIGGLSGWGSVYYGMAQALARRGILCILAEGPGQGSTRLRSGLHLDHTTLPLFSRFVDHAFERGATRVGVWGNSFGGLFAAHVASADTRVGAVCINGAPMTPVVPDFRTAREQMCAVFGVDETGLESRVASLRMAHGQHRIRGSLLVVEGGADLLVPLGEQKSFFELAGPEQCTVMSWPDGEHTIYNHAAERNARLADWFRSQLVGGTGR